MGVYVCIYVCMHACMYRKFTGTYMHLNLFMYECVYLFCPEYFVFTLCTKEVYRYQGWVESEARAQLDKVPPKGATKKLPVYVIHTHTHSHTHAYTHTHTQTHTHTHTHTHAHTHAHIHTHNHTHSIKHTHTHAYAHTQTHKHHQNCLHIKKIYACIHI